MGETALLIQKFPFVFFTKEDWSAEEVKELIMSGIDYLYSYPDEGVYSRSIMELFSVMTYIFVMQSTVRELRFPNELQNKHTNLFYDNEELQVAYLESKCETPRQFAEQFHNKFEMHQVSSEYQELFLKDLRYILDLEQIFYLDNDFSMHMYKKTYEKGFQPFLPTYKNQPMVAVW